ncbi:protein TIC 56, chloroplastic isoform X2 [Cryptomeria japonica]|uniref:protein TIC 56, chloroplastic isoform X2 n=1 Tax=Cryptomeria japonica TaxID=3369 RepID=UPI0025AD2C00|nr:protein TIC 56, chloroplastic isoform X2 [Cryptomeria japonica]
MGWSILGWLRPKKEEEEEIYDEYGTREPLSEAQRKRYMKRWNTFKQETKRLPRNYGEFEGGDYNENRLFDHKASPAQEELEENKKLWEKIGGSKLVEFLAESEEQGDRELKKVLKENELPYWPEDYSLWKALPKVPQPFSGRPLPKNAYQDDSEAKNVFWDFMKQYLFGLWVYRQRPYPAGKPMNVAQAIGSTYLDARYLDFKLAAAGTALCHKLGMRLPLWLPSKGREIKTFKQLQKEGIESKEREKAAMRQNCGVLPGQMIPSHTLFLWASGAELTPLIERDTMPNKYVSYQQRKLMAKVFPGLRPWEILNMEQIMDDVTYAGWYREPLGSYNTGPPFAERQMDMPTNYIFYHLPEDKFFDDLSWFFYNSEFLYKQVKHIVGGKYPEIKETLQRKKRRENELKRQAKKEALKMAKIQLEKEKEKNKDNEK